MLLVCVFPGMVCVVLSLQADRADYMLRLWKGSRRMMQDCQIEVVSKHVSSMVHGVATPSALLPQHKHNTFRGGGGGTGRGFGTQKTGDDPDFNLSALRMDPMHEQLSETSVLARDLC